MGAFGSFSALQTAVRLNMTSNIVKRSHDLSSNIRVVCVV